MGIIEVNNLTKAYEKNKALNDISFTIEENKITGLIGRNGAGKTTLLRIIAGYIRKTSGEISVFCSDPFDNIKFASNMVFIDDKMSIPVALNLTEIFDEPTTGMDISVRKDFYRALLKDYLAFPRTIILSSHLLNEIDELLEDILLIKDGQKYLHSPIDELKEMAICLRGNSEIINMLIKDKEILNKEMMLSQIKCIVYKKDFSDTELQSAALNGIEISSVSVDDLCVYLTSNPKGGIDNVFNRN